MIPFLCWDCTLRQCNVSALFIQCKNDATFLANPREYLFDMMNPYHIQFFDKDEIDPVPVIRMVFALASPIADVVVLGCPERMQLPRDGAFKAKFQEDQYMAFDIWCAKASHETFLPIKDDPVFTELLLRSSVFPNVYECKKSNGLQNATRSMNPGTDVHPAHWHFLECKDGDLLPSHGSSAPEMKIK